MPPSDAMLLEARQAMDRIIARKPEKSSHDFSEATRCLCAYRDELIERGRSPREQERLSRLNAVISVVMAGHFPLGSTPWQDIEVARDWIAEMA